MFLPDTQSLLESRLPGLPKMLLAASLRHDYDELVAMLVEPCTIAVVDDNDTSSALGDHLSRALKSRYRVLRIGCGKAPHADAETVKRLRRESKSAQWLIAVGSGTISDLCKYASHLDGKPYMVFPTAASMNGYASANASITVDGFKTTFPAHLPKAIFCDLSVITSAPSRLSKSGLGDSLARSTAQADWLLSHLLLNTTYDETPFALTAPLESALLESARGIALSDPISLQLLMQTLILSGLGMTIAGGSYPASQSEHLIAHSFEMLNSHAPATLHGEQIGVTAITAATRQEGFLTRPPALCSPAFPKNALETRLSVKALTYAEEAFAQKQQQLETSGLTDATLKARWPDIAHRLQSVMLPAATLAAVLRQAQAPFRPETLGWATADYTFAAAHARYLRDRFTCLDLKEQ